MKEIALTRGLVTVVDDEDFVALSVYKWYAKKRDHLYYAARNETLPDGRRRTILMHIAILGVVGVDHADGNGLNNRRYNLRPCNQAQNQGNRRKIGTRNCSSKFKGVSWNVRLQKWAAYIRKNYKRIHLGFFSDESEAALAYDAAARKHFGEYAKLNFGDKP